MKLVWDKTGERFYETGVKHGVLYPQRVDGSYPKGVAWNGLTAVTESPSGAEATPLYADDMKYLNLVSAEEFGATIEAYTYPDEFKACNGEHEIADGIVIGQQKRQTFGLSYETVIGNDTESNDYGRKIHLIYGALASPSEKAYATINDSPEAITFSWEVSTTPVNVTGFKPTATLTIDSTKVATDKLAALEKVLYGDAGYTALETQPADWATNYTDYFTSSDSGTTGTPVAGESAPEFAAGTYYRANDARLPLPDEVVELVGTVG